MLSYHADMTIDNNPFELGLDRLVDLDMDADFIGKQALRRIRDDGVRQRQVGVEITGPALTGPNQIPWPILVDGRQVGRITSAVYSPRLQRNIALALVDVEHGETGTRASSETDSGQRDIVVVPRPFYDPQKSKTVS